jgi:MFS family permease
MTLKDMDFKKSIVPIFILFFCLFMISVSRGMGESFGVFLLPLSDTFDWDRASVTSIYSVYMFSLGIGSLISGIIFDKFGGKFNYVLGTLLLSCGYYISGYLNELWQFYIFLGVFSGLGASMVGIIPSQSIISKWFNKKLSSALSIAYSGQGLGVLILAPLCQILISKYGWKISYNFIGLFFLGILIVLFFLPWKKINVGIYNSVDVSTNKLNDSSLFEALRENTFWKFFLIYFFTAMGIFGISLQVVVYLIYCGFSDLEAALYFGLMGMLTFPGMALTGFAADIWPKHYVSTLSYILSLLGILSLYCIQYSDFKYLIVFLFIIPFGLSAGARGPIITTLIAKIFAGKGLASIYGASNLGQGLGAALGAFISGFLFDQFSNYNVGFFFCTLFTIIGALLFWLIPNIKKI